MKNLEIVVKKKLFSLDFDREKPVALAFSGGLDSTVLLNILLQIVDNKKLRAIYVCHNLRPKEELAKEILLIKKTCQIMRVRLTLVYIREGAIAEYAKQARCGIEAAARRFRYHALARTAQRWNISTIITAHHADDQIETFLMRLLRGGNLGALAGISPSRAIDKTSGVRVVRPLLQIERRELYNYAEKKGLEWSEDSTNEETIFLRNKIRHSLIPYLDSEFPSWKCSVIGYAPQIRNTQAFLHTCAEKHMHAMQKEYRGRPVLDLNLFKKREAVIRLEILKNFLQNFIYKHHIGYHALQNLDRAISDGALKAEAGGYEFDLTGGVLQFKGRARFSSAPSTRGISFLLDSYREDQYFLKVQAPGKYECGAFKLVVAYDSSNTNIPGLAHIVIDESEKMASVKIPISFPFVFRNKKEGDIIYTEAGIKGIDAIIKKSKIPEGTRHLVPLLEDKYGIAAVLISTFVKGSTLNAVCRNPSLGENGEIVYILLLMKGDHIINV
jgi:tRNA(Ile)-lysidine synthetase-like protein